MTEETDAQPGGESLSIAQAAAAYAKTQTEAVPKDDAKVEDEAASDDMTDDELQASDEDVSDEADGDTGEQDETDADPEDETEPESEQGRFVADNAKVRLSDGTVTTIAEIKSGYLKNADATRKWQDAAELRKTAEARSAAIEASEQQLQQQRDYVATLIKSILPEPPDPSRADPRSPNYDPAGYQADEVQYRAWASHLQAIEQQQSATQKERADAAAKAEKDKADTEWATLIDKLPHLKDEKRVDPFIADLRKTASAYGFAPEELKAIALDHRLALALNDASKWQRLQASKSNVQKKVEGRPPVQKSGKRLNPAEHKARTANDALARAKQSGSLEDVTAAFIASLNKG